MKYVIFAFWLLATIFLVFTIIGMVLFIPSEYGSKSTWMQIGLDLNDKILRD